MKSGEEFLVERLKVERLKVEEEENGFRFHPLLFIILSPSSSFCPLFYSSACWVGFGIIVLRRPQYWLSISQTWFFMTFEIPSDNPFNAMRPNPAFDMAVWGPLGRIMGGLWVHYVVYAFAELRHSRKQEKLTASTRVVFHSTIVCMILALAMHVRVFDALALRGLGKREAFQNQQPLRVWDAKMPGRPLFDMWFAEDAVDSMDW